MIREEMQLAQLILVSQCVTTSFMVIVVMEIFFFPLTTECFFLQPPKETKGSITGLPTISTVMEAPLFVDVTISVGRAVFFDAFPKCGLDKS